VGEGTQESLEEGEQFAGRLCGETVGKLPGSLRSLSAHASNYAKLVTVWTLGLELLARTQEGPQNKALAVLISGAWRRFFILTFHGYQTRHDCDGRDPSDPFGFSIPLPS